MTTWKDWPLAQEWSDEGICPNCGNSLIITECVSEGRYLDMYNTMGLDMHNGICMHCRKQYTISSEHGRLTVNTAATGLVDYALELEERIARIEQVINRGLDTQIPRAVDSYPQRADDEAETITKKYAFLLH